MATLPSMTKLSPTITSTLANRSQGLSIQDIKTAAKSATGAGGAKALSQSFDFASRDKKLAEVTAKELIKNIGALWLELPPEVRGVSTSTDIADRPAVEARIHELALQAVKDLRESFKQDPALQPVGWQIKVISMKEADDATAALFAQDETIATSAQAAIELAETRIAEAEAAAASKKRNKILLIAGGAIAVLGLGYFALSAPAADVGAGEGDL